MRKLVRQSIYTGKADVRIVDSTVTLELPAIITQELFERAQNSLNHRVEKRGAKLHWYVLRGLVHCGVCGRRCRVTRNTRGGSYYVCGANKAQRICPQPNIKVGTVDDIAWHTFAAFLANPEMMREAGRQHTSNDTEKDSLESSVAGLTARLSKLDGQIERCIARIARSEDDEEAGIFESQLAQLRQKKQIAIRARDEVLARLGGLQRVVFDESVVQAAMALLKSSRMSEELKRDLFLDCQARVVILEDAVEVQLPGIVCAPAGTLNHKRSEAPQ